MKAKIAFLFAVHHIAQALLHAVVVVEGQHHGLAAVQVLRAVHVFECADDNFVTALAGACRSAVEYAAARSRFTINYIGRNALAVAFVPDIDKFQRVNASLTALFGIQGN